jgi:OmpA-OmpF porin, OOP family
MRFKFTLLLFLCSIFTQLSYAQQVNKRYELGVLLGTSGYLGDLNKSDFFSKEPQASFGLLGRYYYNEKWTFRGGLTIGKLTGSDANYADRANRGFKTTSPITDISGIVEWDFLGKRRFSYDTSIYQVKFKRTLSPYFFTGFGVAFTNPKADFTGTANTLAEFRQGAIADQAAKYSNTSAVIPFGFGVKYDINENFVIALEAGFRLAFSDYLDGISKGANPGKNDRYKLSGLTITYRFDKKDTDRDGIPDETDACPKQAGPVKLNGCPDFDKDGVADKDDECPEVYGLIALKGCPDNDGDGIANQNDECPDAYGSLTLKGCPDKDKDGIADKNDTCPDVAGLVALGGCPDTDKDGIADKDDACPIIAGSIQMKGCPDADNDGIADKDDACPTVAGTLNGCPDGDGDSIADKDDACPTVAGITAFNGCPDTDNDGVEDAKDRQPTIAGKPEFEGALDAPTLANLIKEEQKAARIAEQTAKKEALSSQNKLIINKKDTVTIDNSQKIMDVKVAPILFELNKATIQPIYSTILDDVATMMTKNPTYKLRIVGHADEIGGSQLNQLLSEKRAEACFDYLLSKGVSANRMSFNGYGEKTPVAPNTTEEGRQQNRRVTIEAFKQ